MEFLIIHYLLFTKFVCMESSINFRGYFLFVIFLCFFLVFLIYFVFILNG